MFSTGFQRQAVTGPTSSIKTAPDAPVCVVCKEAPKYGKLFCCAKCQDVNPQYMVCSKACQTKDWQHHKHTTCVRVKATATTVTANADQPKQCLYSQGNNNGKVFTVAPPKLCFICKADCGPTCKPCSVGGDAGVTTTSTGSGSTTQSFYLCHEHDRVLYGQKESLKKGYKWYLKDCAKKGTAKEKTTLSKLEWSLQALQILVDLDEKTKPNHGALVWWMDGNRANCYPMNVTFEHICDMLVRWRLYEWGGYPGGESLFHFLVQKGDYEPNSSFETNMFDDLTQDQINFTRENWECFWLVFSRLDFKIPMMLEPPVTSSRLSHVAESIDYDGVQNDKWAKVLLDKKFVSDLYRGLFRRQFCFRYQVNEDDEIKFDGKKVMIEVSTGELEVLDEENGCEKRTTVGAKELLTGVGDFLENMSCGASGSVDDFLK